MSLSEKLKNLFGKAPEPKDYDREHLRPMIRASICTAEQTAGFRDSRDGKFHEVMLLRTDADLEEFCRTYGIQRNDITTEY